MIALGIAVLTASIVLLIIGIALFIDAHKEYHDNASKIEKVSRNFGFPKKQIDIDRKGQQ